MPSREIHIAIRAWNMCGGMDWSAIPVVAEILGYEDIEMLIAQMCAIREFNDRE